MVLCSGATRMQGTLLGVMGLQQVRDVTLIRHAYVRTSQPEAGGRSPLAVSFAPAGERPGANRNLGRCRLGNPLLRNGMVFKSFLPKEKDRLLKQYWKIPERQIETSVVLADAKWRELKRPPVMRPGA